MAHLQAHFRMFSRRQFGHAAWAAGLVLAAPWRLACAKGDPSAELPAAFAAIEAGVGGRLGVAVLDTDSGRWFGHRADERFPMCSTFKLLAVGAVLARVDAGRDHLDRIVRFGAGDLVDYSPVTERFVGGTGVSMADLCAAAIMFSDNTAANLLLVSLGGPAGVTAFARSLGDGVTRLDRTETSLNEVPPGDMRDTTSPSSMVADLRALVLGTALSGASRGRLTEWLVGCRTGDARVRAGLPEGWRAGDKTGTWTGAGKSANDVCIVWPPRRGPILLAVYLNGSGASAARRNAAHAAVGRAVAAALG